MTFPILYKYTQKGQAQQWQIFTEGDKYWTEEGIVGGILTKSLPTVCKGKNSGKKNETSDTQQAELEAAAKHKKKLESHYNEVLQEERSFFEPILAFDVKEKKIKELPPLDSDEEFAVPVFGSPKFDGLRAINKGSLLSRNGKEFLGCPHLCQDEFLLDGEIYNHDLHDDFNKIASIVKQQKPTTEQLQESKEKAQYWIFDAPEVEGNFLTRYQWLVNYFKSPDINPSYRLAPIVSLRSWEEVRVYQAKCLEDGYEGVMLRLDGPYENKRSKYLLKYKDFVDEEFEIIGAEQGEGGRTGTIGFFWLWLDLEKPYVIHPTKPINCFKSNVKGNFKYLAELWNEHESYIGKSATVKYQNRTPLKADGTGNVPRFPYIIKINREEYE